MTVRGPIVVIVVLAVAIAGALVGVLLAGDGDDPPAPEPALVAASAVALEPTDWYGREIVVGAEVRDILAPNAFTTGGEGFEGHNRLLVVAPAPIAEEGADGARPLLQGDVVTVQGELRLFELDALREEVADLPDRFERFDGQPVLLAEDVIVNRRLLTEQQEATAAQVVTSPRAWLGTLVSVDGRVEREVDDDAFVLEGGLLVLVPPAVGEPPAAGESVTVVGSVRRFDYDQLGGLRDSFDGALFGDFVDQPVLVAGQVRASGD